MLIFLWLLPLLVKIVVATLEVSIANPFHDITIKTVLTTTEGIITQTNFILHNMFIVEKVLKFFFRREMLLTNVLLIQEIH